MEYVENLTALDNCTGEIVSETWLCTKGYASAVFINIDGDGNTFDTDGEGIAIFMHFDSEGKLEKGTKYCFYKNGVIC